MNERSVKSSWLFICLVTILVAFLLTGCSGGSGASNNSVSEPTEDSISDADEELEDGPDAPKEEKWHKIKEFSGSGAGDSGPFEITTERYWRATVTLSGGDAQFTASLYKAGEDPASAPHHGQVTGSGGDPVSLNFTETGNFFWRMETSGGAWKILVEEIEFVYAE